MLRRAVFLFFLLCYRSFDQLQFFVFFLQVLFCVFSISPFLKNISPNLARPAIVQHLRIAATAVSLSLFV